MPKLIARNTVYKAFSSNIRVSSGCPLFKLGSCDHPMFTLENPKRRCVLEGEGECPLEKHPLMLYRLPDWLDEAHEDAIHEHSRG